MDPIQRLSRLAPLGEALACLDALAKPVAPRTMALTDAMDRVLAADLVVTRAIPPAPIALRDGWAVRSELLTDAGPYAPQPLTPSPPWVESGDRLPRGADAVIAADGLQMTGSVAEGVAPAVTGEGVLAVGADAEPARALRRTGERLRGLDVAVLRAAGIAQVTVREPRLRVICANPAIEAARDTVAPLLARDIAARGGLCKTGRVPDVEALARALEEDGSDAIVVIGGTGAGRRDRSVETLARVGRLHMHGIGIAPGESSAIGVIGSLPVLLVPGRLDAALAAWLLLGRHLLARLTLLARAEPAGRLPLRRKIVSTVGMAEMVPVRCREGGAEPLASNVLPLRALARADGYVVVAPETEGFPPGSLVEVWPLP